ncbi:serine hydrolase [Enterococcus sp. JM4C]|uniref:serine hydrolase domain-containing protein n=1 Tax=Candidatus Enterococcus huntleyi TaxID=1857217 RepID=UPI00137A597C|nr:serine hydrolase domain-containing protein [Enterococcus sp. JM4C]KAF1295541.1 serine hydrolase [Enterococcus sp. JM4C]
MYPQTQKIISQKQAQGIFPGAVYAFIEPEQEQALMDLEENQNPLLAKNRKFTQEIHVLGQARIVPESYPMEEDFLFDVASLTKVVCTTSLVLRLIEDGKIDLDAPLKNYLLAFQDERITIRHLLTHTSDIQTWIPDRDKLSQSELKAAYLTLKSGDQLGQQVKYTDAGTILLGFMLEELYWDDATDIFQEEVLNPLGMMHSLFSPHPSKRIVPTEQLASGEVLHGVTHDPKARVLAEHAGNAGLFTTIGDLIKFVTMYLRLGSLPEGQFLREETIKELLRDQTPTGEGQRSLGWDLKVDLSEGRPLLFHTGYTGTFILIDILEGSGFIFLSNRVHPTDHREEYIQVRDEILKIYLTEKAQKKK